jgi:hypothetical protein
MQDMNYASWTGEWFNLQGDKQDSVVILNIHPFCLKEKTLS